MSEWISVNERLPEEECLCLVYDTSLDCPIFVRPFYPHVYARSKNYWRYITHWMPLPEAPHA